jgi:hypothetical protein
MREQELHTEGRENCGDVWLLSHGVASLGRFKGRILCIACMRSSRCASVVNK